MLVSHVSTWSDPSLTRAKRTHVFVRLDGKFYQLELCANYEFNDKIRILVCLEKNKNEVIDKRLRSGDNTPHIIKITHHNTHFMYFKWIKIFLMYFFLKFTIRNHQIFYAILMHLEWNFQRIRLLKFFWKFTDLFNGSLP